MSEVQRVSEHPKKKSFDSTPSDGALRAEDGWVDMDVRWLLTSETVGAEHSVFGITVFTPGSKHDIHRHPNAEEFEYLVSGHGIARVGNADVELGPGEVVDIRRRYGSGAQAAAFQWALERLEALGLIAWTRGRSVIHLVVSPRADVS